MKKALPRTWGKISKGQMVFDIFNVLFMLMLSIVMFYPLWHVLCASLSGSSELMGYNGILLTPKGFSIASYKLMLKHPLIISGYINTILIVVTAVTINIILTSLCAYILSRKNVYWSKFLNIMVLITMFFSGGLIPTYLLVSKTLYLNNSLWAVILPTAINVYNMIIMKTSFMGIPDSLEESVKLDGGGHWTILFKIILPLSKAIIAVITLYYAVTHWNAWFDAAIYLSDRNKFPLQLVLREILINNDASSMSDASAVDQESVGETIKYATIIFATVPVLCIYPFLQKYFTSGVMIGAVKG